MILPRLRRCIGVGHRIGRRARSLDLESRLLGGGLAALAFMLPTIPFLAKVWRRDRGALLPAAGLLWVRAVAWGWDSPWG